MEFTGIEDRKRVWSALSGLFLDTELEPSDLDWIAVQLRACPYSVEEIEEILKFEVTPVLKWNLMQVAGEWAGFDEAWLQAKLMPLVGRKPLFQQGVSKLIRTEWEAVKARIDCNFNNGA